MNVNEVRNAQKIIRNAKNELAIIVKDFFESTHPIIVNNLQPLSIMKIEELTSFCTTIRKNGLEITVEIFCGNSSDCIYAISCTDLGISYYYPSMDNNLTAQGESEIYFYTTAKGKTNKESSIEKIRFRNYDVN